MRAPHRRPCVCAFHRPKLGIKLPFRQRQPHSSETKKKMSASRKGWCPSTATRLKMSLAKRGKKPHNFIPTEQLLVLNGEHKSHLRERLIKEGFLENRCALCGMEPEWQGKSLTLQLDHKNGNKRDSRLENLRLLCPNCHAQTPTWGRKTCLS